ARIRVGGVVAAALPLDFLARAQPAPALASTVPPGRSLAWGSYLAAMVGLALVPQGVVPALERQAIPSAGQGDGTHVTVTVQDDGGEVFVATGGQLVVDLTGWPSSEWAVTFKSSNPSVLELMPDKTESPATR